MSKILLKSISHENKVSKGGKNYVSCKLVVYSKKDNKDIYISGFGGDVTRTWQAGDEVEVSLSQTEKGYWNFELNENSKPSPDKKLALLEEINFKLDLLLTSSNIPKTQKNAVKEQISGKNDLSINSQDPNTVTEAELNEIENLFG